MHSLQRAGGYAALVQGLLIVVVAALFAVVLPGRGFSATDDLGNWAKLVPVMPVFGVVNAVAILRSVAYVVVILGAGALLQDGAPARARVAVASACIGSTLFLAQGMLGVSAWPILLRDPAAAPVAGAAVQAISQSLVGAALFAQGWVVVLIGWAGLSTRKLSLPLSAVMVVAGALCILAFLAGTILLAAMVLTLLWTVWLGAELLRAEPTPRAAVAPAGTVARPA